MNCKSYTKELGYCPVIECKLSHPPKCRNDDKCFKDDCTFFHSVSKCQYDQCPNKKNCTQRHVKKAKAVVPESTSSLASTLSNSTPLVSASTPPVSTSNPPASHPPKCRNDDKCFKEDCTFFHSVSICQYDQCPNEKNCNQRHVKKTKLPASSNSISNSTSKSSTNNFNIEKYCKEYQESIKLYNQQLELAQDKLFVKEQEIKDYQFRDSESFEVLSTKKFAIDIIKSQIQVSKDTMESISNHYNSIISSQLSNESIMEIRNSISKVYREIWRLKYSLPALSKRREIQDKINSMNSSNNFIIIKGATGSGKSTQVPQYIADMDEFKGKTIICTQPRKLAALTLKERVSVEYKAENPNSESNEQVSVINNGSNVNKVYSRIVFCTESTLISKIGDIIQSVNQNQNQHGGNWLNDRIGAIIIDEAHERNINTDLLIGLLKMNRHLWSNLKIIVTSASLDTKLFLNYLNNCPLVEIPGKTFPVQVYYSESVSDQNIVNSVVSKALELFKFPGGDILCFLTGQDEVEKAKARFDQKYASSTDKSKDFKKEPISLCLYGKQLPEDQKKVFEATPKEKRKVIFSTDVAETSITIDGLEFVIDSGLTKSNIYDSQRNTMSLKVHTISKSSADQRKGRAGRTMKGVCYRLYSSNEYDQMQEGVTAEIFCRPLSTLVATLVSMSINPLSFNWIESPPKKSIEMAFSQLKVFNAIRSDQEEINENTPTSIISTYLSKHIGQMVVKLQVDPGIMNMIYQSCKLGFGEAATRIAGIMNVGSMILWRGNDDKSKADASAKHSTLTNESLFDINAYYQVFNEWLTIKSKQREDHQSIGSSKWSSENYLNNKALGIVHSISLELINSLKDSYEHWNSRDQKSLPTPNDIRKLSLYSQFNNIAVQIKPGVYKTVPIVDSNELSVVANLHPSSIVKRVNGSSLPETVFYQSILKTSKQYLSMVTSIEDLQWINQVTLAGNDLDKVEKVRRESKVEQITIENVSRFILVEILGKQGSKSDSVIDRLQCESLCSRIKDQRFSCLFNPYKVESGTIRERMQNMIDQVRDKLNREAIEELYLGQNRAVFGSGLKVIDILSNSNQFISIHISNLPSQLNSVESISNYIIKVIKANKLDYGGIPESSLIRQVYIHPCSKDKKGWAKVMLYNSSLAIQVQKLINGEVYEGINVLSCTGSGISLPSTSSSISGTLVITLNNTDGTGRLTFGETVTLQQLQSLAIFTKIKENGRFKLLNNSYDEDNIRECLFKHKLPQPTKITLYRQPSEFEYLNQLEMDEIIPHSTNLNSGIPFEVKSSKIYGIKYYFNDASVLEDFIQKIKHNPKYKINVYYSSNLSIHFQINKLNQDSIDRLSKEFVSSQYGNQFKSITNTATTTNSNSSFEYKLSSKNLEQLKSTIKSFHLLCNPSDIFTHPSKELIFSRYGRKCMAKLSSETYLYWNNKTHTVMIYSDDKNEIQQAKNQLVNLVTELEMLQIDVKITLTLKGRSELIEQEKKDSKYIIKLVDGIKDSAIIGRDLFVTGTQESIELLKEKIKDKLVSRGRGINQLISNECSVCGDSEDELFTLQKCGHQFCRSCIRYNMLNSGMITQECLGFGCKSEISLCDILNICSSEDLDSIKRRSILDYQRKNRDKLCCCPNPLCLQLLQLNENTNGERLDGSFAFCDQCNVEYCIECSNKKGKASLSHKGIACGIESSSLAKLHDLLNIKCPGCNMVFNEFNGCYAVQCTGSDSGSGCNSHFCGFCLTLSPDSGSNHQHVLSCQKNPTHGSYFADIRIFYDLRNAEKKERIISCLKNENDLVKRVDLFKSIKILCEFNINESDII